MKTYEQKYNEALEKAKECLQDGTITTIARDYILEIFPELKESEDERMRKAIHIYIDWLDGRKDYQPKGDYTIRDMIAWLEKQGEQKPVWSEEDERHKNTIIRAIHGAGNITPIDGELAEKWLKSIRPQKQWKPTEEQMDALETAVSAIQSNTLETLYQDLKREKNYE